MNQENDEVLAAKETINNSIQPSSDIKQTSSQKSNKIKSLFSGRKTIVTFLIIAFSLVAILAVFIFINSSRTAIAVGGETVSKYQYNDYKKYLKTANVSKEELPEVLIKNLKYKQVLATNKVSSFSVENDSIAEALYEKKYQDLNKLQKIKVDNVINDNKLKFIKSGYKQVLKVDAAYNSLFIDTNIENTKHIDGWGDINKIQQLKNEAKEFIDTTAKGLNTKVLTPEKALSNRLDDSKNKFNYYNGTSSSYFVTASNNGEIFSSDAENGSSIDDGLRDRINGQNIVGNAVTYTIKMENPAIIMPKGFVHDGEIAYGLVYLMESKKPDLSLYNKINKEYKELKVVNNVK